jgi:hypothetical protein
MSLDNDIRLPEADRPNDITQFHMAVIHAIDNNTKALNALGEKLDDLTVRHWEVANEFRDAQTRVKTIMSIASAVWVAVAGYGAFWLEKTATKAELQVSRLEKLEKWSEIETIMHKPLEGMPDAIQSMKLRLNTMEDKIDNMEKQRK